VLEEGVHTRLAISPIRPEIAEKTTGKHCSISP
jgi:hypothetical protein